MILRIQILFSKIYLTPSTDDAISVSYGFSHGFIEIISKQVAYSPFSLGMNDCDSILFFRTEGKTIKNAKKTKMMVQENAFFFVKYVVQTSCPKCWNTLSLLFFNISKHPDWSFVIYKMYPGGIHKSFFSEPQISEIFSISAYFVNPSNSLKPSWSV